MNNNIYENNTKAFNDRKFYYTPGEDTSFSFEHGTSVSGQTITVVETNKKKFFLSGLYDPDKTATLRAKQIYKDKCKLQIFIGLGDGRIVREYCKLADKNTLILIFEPCQQIFSEVMKTYPLDDLFMDERLLFFCEKEEKIVQNFLCNLIKVEFIPNMNCFIMDNYEKIHGSGVSLSIKLVNQAVRLIEYEWETQIYFEDCYSQNLFSNLKYYGEAYNGVAIADAFPNDVPVLIVASGPSLNKNIEDIKAAKGKALIVACDTSLKPLLNKGIIPDAFIVVDAKKKKELFEHEQIWNIPMISDYDIPTYIMDKHIGKKILFSSEPLLYELLVKAKGENEASSSRFVNLPTGGSVANSAFSFANLIGAKTLIMVGQDLASTGGKRHVDGAFNGAEIAEDEDMQIEVDSIDGGKVGTSKVFLEYLQWYEREINVLPDINVVDATEGGALIRGTKVMTLKEAIKTYCNKSFDFDEMLSKTPKYFSDEERRNLQNAFKEIPQDLEKIKILAKRAISDYDKLKKKVNNSGDIKEKKKLLKKIGSINESIESSYLWNTLQRSCAQTELSVWLSMSNEIENRDDAIAVDIMLGQNLMDSIVHTVDELLPLADELAKAGCN